MPADSPAITDRPLIGRRRHTRPNPDARTLFEAANLLGYRTTITVRGLCEKGDLEGKIIEGVLWVSYNSIGRFLEANPARKRKLAGGQDAETPEPKMVSTKEAAARLNIKNASSVRRLYYGGSLEGELKGRDLYITVASIEEYNRIRKQPGRPADRWP